MATKKGDGGGKLKEALGIIAVIAATGLVLLLVFVLSRCDGKKTDVHDASLASTTTVVDKKTGITYVRCPNGIGANTLKDVYLSIGAGSNTITMHEIAFEDPKKYISEAKDAFGGSFVYRAEDTEEITLDAFAPIAAGIFMGELNAPIGNFYSKSMAEEDSNLEDGSKYVDIIKNTLLSSNETTPTGEFSDTEFYIRLYSENFPGLYYEVVFRKDVNGVAYLLDAVTGKLVVCPDEITVKMTD